ncbi:MAG: pyrroline-5-carboxylate reductase [Candidatus Brocadiae bacterium]|nr:pyrroline-5-carboxylate reductase [Candidatus Brocadiia bacterium]
MLEHTIGFVGAGMMGEAFARGLLDAKLVSPDHLLMTDADPQRRAAVADQLGITVLESNTDLVARCQVVILAVKPDVVRDVLPGLADVIGEEHLVVSIAAGVTLDELEGLLAEGAHIVRVMPNTPCLVGEGAAGVALGQHATQADGDLVGKILSSVGICVFVPEKLMDAVTGLSGSGPAFVALVIEAMADAGVLCGLPRPVALKLAAQTVLGAGKLVRDTGKSPADLKDMVTSPGGTTIEGVKVLEEGGLRATLIRAVEAATAKSKKLGRS